MAIDRARKLGPVTDAEVEAASFVFWESISPGTGTEYEPADARAMRAALEASRSVLGGEP